MSLNDRIEQYKCNWLKDYLKELIISKDFKTYNRIKRIIYYFPDALKSITMEELKITMKNASDTYICLGAEDIRYKAFDNMYEKKYGEKFNPPSWGEARYITIDKMCEYFGL